MLADSVIADPQISLLVCSCNGAQTIPLTLRGLALQTLPRDSYEVIVVDDGSSDNTAAVAAEHGAKVIRLDQNSGIAAARNAGVSEAQAPLIAFVDDDCEVPTDWAAEILAAFEDPLVDGVGGRVVAESASPFLRGYLQTHNPLVPLPVELLKPRGPVRRLADYLSQTFRGATVSPAELYSVVGANMAFRKAAISSVGGFDEALFFGPEEEDLCFRLHQRLGDARIVYRDTAWVTHWFKPSLRDSLRRSRAYGSNTAQVYLKHPSYRLIVYPFPAICAVSLATGILAQRRHVALASLTLPWLLYPRWIKLALARRSLTPASYPIISLLQEIMTMAGEFEGISRGYDPSSRLRHNGENANPSNGIR